MNIIQCYVPTNEADEEMKEEFYNQLQAVVSKQGDKDIMVVMGDVSAKIGADSRGYEQVMSRHGLGTMKIENCLQIFAHQTALSSGAVFSLTDAYTRQHGDHLTM